MKTHPFTIAVEDSVLTDLEQRLAATRLAGNVDKESWNYGTSPAYINELLEYWQDTFDWRKAEKKLNQLPQYKTNIDGMDIHFIHQKTNDPKAPTMILLHGWPDSFIRFNKILPLLTHPADGEQGFNVIVPSIPGFGFSSKPQAPGWTVKSSAHIFTQLMGGLGYTSYIAVGGDGGSPIAQLMAHQAPEAVKGVYLTDRGFTASAPDPATQSEAEKAYFQAMQMYSFTEGAYAMLQMTKPQTLAYGLNDSPVGLASWIIEKFYGWSDNGGNLDNTFTKDELLTNIMIYWATQTIDSSIRVYREELLSPSIPAGTFLKAPTGFGLFPKEAAGVFPPEELLKRDFNLVYRSELAHGGHFTAMEQPKLMASDLRAFSSKL